MGGLGEGNGIEVLRGHRLKETNGVTKDGTRITALHFENGAEVKAKMFIDAIYEGDLLAFAGLSFVVGREGNAKYGETHNGIRTDTTHKQHDKPIDPYRTPGDAASGLIFGDFVLTEAHLRRANLEPVRDSVRFIRWLRPREGRLRGE